jgi:hypothetical protein
MADDVLGKKTEWLDGVPSGVGLSGYQCYVLFEVPYLIL